MEEKITDYQRGLVDGIAGVIGVILSECDPEMKKRVLEKLQLKQTNPY